MNAAAHEVDNVGTCKLIVSFVTCLCFISYVVCIGGNTDWYQLILHAHPHPHTLSSILKDAAKAAGVKKVVLVSSILTNGRNWGQEKSPGFVVTNAFGNVLDEKLVAENYLKASGLDYTIVRPGGLKAKAPTGALKILAEDTTNAG